MKQVQLVRHIVMKKGNVHMAVVKEIKEGRCRITIYNDCYINRTEEEVQQIIKSVSAIIYESMRRERKEKFKRRNPSHKPNIDK